MVASVDDHKGPQIGLWEEHFEGLVGIGGFRVASGRVKEIRAEASRLASRVCRLDMAGLESLELTKRGCEVDGVVGGVVVFVVES